MPSNPKPRVYTSRAMSEGEQKEKKLIYQTMWDLRSATTTIVPKVTRRPTVEKFIEWGRLRQAKVELLKVGMHNLAHRIQPPAVFPPDYLKNCREVLQKATVEIARPMTHEEYFAGPSPHPVKSRTKTLPVADGSVDAEPVRKFGGDEVINVPFKVVYAPSVRYGYGPSDVAALSRDECVVRTLGVNAAVMQAMAKGASMVSVAATVQGDAIGRNTSNEIGKMYQSPLRKEFHSPQFTESCMFPVEMLTSLFLKSMGTTTSFGTWVFHPGDLRQPVNVKMQDFVPKEQRVERCKACHCCGRKRAGNMHNSSNHHSSGASSVVLADYNINAHSPAMAMMVEMSRQMCLRCQDSLQVVLFDTGFERLLLELQTLPPHHKQEIVNELAAKCVDRKWTPPVYPSPSDPIGAYGSGGVCRHGPYDPLHEFLFGWLNLQVAVPLEPPRVAAPKHKRPRQPAANCKKNTAAPELSRKQQKMSAVAAPTQQFESLDDMAEYLLAGPSVSLALQRLPSPQRSPALQYSPGGVPENFSLSPLSSPITLDSEVPEFVEAPPVPFDDSMDLCDFVEGK